MNIEDFSKEKVIKVIISTVVAFILTFIIVNIAYALGHYSFSVTVPDRYDPNSPEYAAKPFPVNEAIEYWQIRGQALAFKCGIAVSVITLVFSLKNKTITKIDF